jgi:TfoX/Sxy family transcriptional regulator of competence genes
MAYDEGLAQRIYEQFEDRTDVEAKKMFGGLCFMVSGHMCCGIVGETLMARVGPANYASCLDRPHAREMDFTGKAMKGMIYIAAAGLESDSALADWLDICTRFIETLPAKK